jgi:hypothetical protein
MIDIIIIIVGAILAILGLAYLAKHGRGMFSSAQFTAQSSMYGFGSEDRKHAIEEVQYVQQDEIKEDTGPDDQGVRDEDDDTKDEK